MIGILIFLAVLLVIAAANLQTLVPLEKAAADYGEPASRESKDQANWPTVTILLPARNEEGNIEACVRSLLDQQYPRLELLVLNDGSQDRTGEILANLAQEDERLRTLTGRPLPPGWLGKNWACAQLAGEAHGELLLFTDADTRHHPQAVREATQVMLADGLDLLSALPRQITVTWGERLIVPIIYWSLISFFPLAMASRLRKPAIAPAIGQFLLIRRSALIRIGGHAAVRVSPAEDLALARRAVAAGLHVRLLDGSRRISCRMYSGFRDAFEGLSKNLIAAFGYRVLPFTFAWLWIGIAFLWPPVLLIFLVLYGEPLHMEGTLALAAVLEAALLWGLAAARFGFPLQLAILYPFPVLVGMVIAARSLWLTLSGQATWKDRTLAKPAMKWW